MKTHNRSRKPALRHTASLPSRLGRHVLDVALSPLDLVAGVQVRRATPGRHQLLEACYIVILRASSVEAVEVHSRRAEAPFLGGQNIRQWHILAQWGRRDPVPQLQKLDSLQLVQPRRGLHVQRCDQSGVAGGRGCCAPPFRVEADRPIRRTFRVHIQVRRLQLVTLVHPLSAPFGQACIDGQGRPPLFRADAWGNLVLGNTICASIYSNCGS
mmetsp:Transcript_18081/g.52182  ORF Transcript_18081/g.52182 Transcript_18081/m.52182 type:complete len:213 (-) Transcript_18081:5030-5668(-)